MSTHPPPGLFTCDAETIARTMASRRVSPKGIGSGIRMVQFFINRAGKNLSARQRRVLERAKRLLQERVRAGRSGSSSGNRNRAPGRRTRSVARRTP